jgi:dTMP kinase
LNWLDDLEFCKLGIPRPDAVFLLLMPVEVGQLLVDKKGSRPYVGGQRRDIHEADISHLRDAEKAYIYCANRYGWQIINCANGNTLESVRTKEEIAGEILEKVVKVLSS